MLSSVRSYRWCGGIGSGKSAALRLAVSDAMARGIRPIAYLPCSTDVGLRTERVEFKDQEVGKMLGVDHLAGRLVRYLSSGERQRVRLASTLSKGTMLAALDEPCRHLDPAHIRSLNDVLSLRAESGMRLAVCDSRRLLASGLFEKESGPNDDTDTIEARVIPSSNGKKLVIDIPIPFVLSETEKKSGQQPIAIESGTLIVVRGTNGSGKTSLLETLAQCGAKAGLRVGISRQEPEQQVFGATPSVELSDVKELHPAAKWCIPQGSESASFDRLIDTLQLQKWLNHATPRIPLGVLSLLGTAVALWMGQDLVLLDEPTQGLDASSARGLVSELARCANAGARIVVASHDPEVIRAASQEWFIEAGKLRIDGAAQ